MNKLPLPVHLLADIRGFSILGQTSFGGYFKIILAWWLNSCPDVLEHQDEWLSLSGMRTSDYSRYKSKIEPLLITSIAVLRQYREERALKTAHNLVNINKARTVRNRNIALSKARSKTNGDIVDKNTPVNPAFIKPTPQPFHEGWNLERGKSPNINKKGTIAPTLLDK